MAPQVDLQIRINIIVSETPRLINFLLIFEGVFVILKPDFFISFLRAPEYRVRAGCHKQLDVVYLG